MSDATNHPAWGDREDAEGNGRGVECPACAALFAPGDEVVEVAGGRLRAHKRCGEPARGRAAEVVDRFVRVVEALPFRTRAA